MSRLLAALRNARVILTDGGIGTMLLAHLDPDRPCPDSLNLERPHLVRALAQDYRRAGAMLLQTNTFGASPCRLAPFGLESRVAEINRAAVEAIRTDDDNSTLIAGTVGPSGLFVQPDAADPLTAEENLRRQIAPLFEAGVDMLLVETLSSSDEALLGLQVARELDASVPVAISYHYIVGKDRCHTLSGETLAETVGKADRNGADIIGANCGDGSAAMLRIADELLAATERPLICRPNAGQPRITGGRPVWPESPGDMVENLVELVRRGIRIVGGCCGTTPAHIAALHLRLHNPGAS